MILGDAETGLAKARAKAGGSVGIGRAIGISSQAVSQWKRVPAERVIEVERATGVPREELRPDLYPAAARPSPSQTEAA